MTDTTVGNNKPVVYVVDVRDRQLAIRDDPFPFLNPNPELLLIVLIGCLDLAVNTIRGNVGWTHQ